jgi:hypothetical protein
MPPFTGTTSVIETKTVISVAAAGSGTKLFNFICHWRRIATTVAIDKTLIDTAYQAAIVVPLMAALNARATQVNNQVRSMNDANDLYSTVAHAVVGAIAGDSMPTEDAAFLLLRTNLRGKSYRGSKHLGPMSESDSTAGTEDLFNAACLARLATIAAAIVAGFTDTTPNTWKPSVLSRISPAQYRTNPTTVVANDCTSIAVKKTIGSMLHRKAKSVY